MNANAIFDQAMKLISQVGLVPAVVVLERLKAST
jgi:hypothetical protein